MSDNSSNSSQSFYTPPTVQTSDAEAFSFNFHRILSGKFFIRPVQVSAVKGVAPDLTVDILPLITGEDISGGMIENSVIFNCPVFRLQRGNSAVIMDPVVGDIGYAAVCDKDMTIVRASKSQSLAGGKRDHSMSDAIYMGGFLNAQPDQYIEFANGSINLVTPNPINIQCSSANITAPGGVSITTPNLSVTGNITAGGNITDNNGTQSASIKSLRDAYDAHKHPVSGVQTGSSTVTSNITDTPV